MSTNMQDNVSNGIFLTGPVEMFSDESKRSKKKSEAALLVVPTIYQPVMLRLGVGILALDRHHIMERMSKILNKGPH